MYQATKSITSRPLPSSASAKPLQTARNEDLQQHHLDTITQIAATDLAPTIKVYLQSANSACNTLVLPDSGADISAAGPQLLQML